MGIIMGMIFAFNNAFYFCAKKNKNLLHMRRDNAKAMMKFLQTKNPYLVESYDLIYSTFLGITILRLDSHHKRNAYVNNCLFEIEELKEQISYNKQVLVQIKSPNVSHVIEADLKALPTLIEKKFKQNHQDIMSIFEKILDDLIESGEYLEKSNLSHFMNFNNEQNLLCIKAIIEEIDNEEAQQVQRLLEDEKKLNIQTRGLKIMNTIETKHTKALSL
jgi:hypothetical protein